MSTTNSFTKNGYQRERDKDILERHMGADRHLATKEEQLIISGDWNQDTTNKKLVESFMKRRLIPAIAGRHGNELPPTYKNGSKPIDEIFVS